MEQTLSEQIWQNVKKLGIREKTITLIREMREEKHRPAAYGTYGDYLLYRDIKRYMKK